MGKQGETGKNIRKQGGDIEKQWKTQKYSNKTGKNVGKQGKRGKNIGKQEKAEENR